MIDSDADASLSLIQDEKFRTPLLFCKWLNITSVRLTREQFQLVVCVDVVECGRHLRKSL